MPDFGTPFAGLDADRKLTKEELIRAMRFAVASEYEATQLYEQIAMASPDLGAQKVLRDIADEELVHVGEFLKVVKELSPEDKELYERGEQEAASLIQSRQAFKKLASDIDSISTEIEAEVPQAALVLDHVADCIDRAIYAKLITPGTAVKTLIDILTKLKKTPGLIPGIADKIDKFTDKIAPYILKTSFIMKKVVDPADYLEKTLKDFEKVVKVDLLPGGLESAYNKLKTELHKVNVEEPVDIEEMGGKQVKLPKGKIMSPATFLKNLDKKLQEPSVRDLMINLPKPVQKEFDKLKKSIEALS